MSDLCAGEVFSKLIKFSREWNCDANVRKLDGHGQADKFADFNKMLSIESLADGRHDTLYGNPWMGDWVIWKMVRFHFKEVDASKYARTKTLEWNVVVYGSSFDNFVDQLNTLLTSIEKGQLPAHVVRYFEECRISVVNRTGNSQCLPQRPI